MRVLLIHPNHHSSWTTRRCASASSTSSRNVVGGTAVTPVVYKAEGLLKIAKDVNPEIVAVLGGIHGTFMYPRVPKEAPWIDAIVRGEGEQPARPAC